MNWTESQLEAIETRRRPILVSAGAGSGKTRVLVERFLRLLEENKDWRIPHIVAVTFTERAAREMTSRIRRDVRFRIERTKEATERRWWREHRNALDSARIGTIHSLCAAILRAHPAEAGLDPGFQVFDEVEAAILRDRAIDEVLEEAASAIEPKSAPDVEIFAYLSPFAVRSALRALLSQGERARQAVSRVSALSDRDIVQYWRELLEGVRREAVLSILRRDSWKADAEIIKGYSGRGRWDKREQCRAQVAGLLTELETVLGANDSDAHMTKENGDKAASLLLQIASSINLKGGSSARWRADEDFNEVGDALGRLRSTIRGEKLLSLRQNDSDVAAARVTACLVRLYGRAEDRFVSLKRQRATLDFNDLEDIAERVLSSHPDVRERYTNPQRGLIRALMVDEFQDISPIQKRILWMLAPGSDELFIIGDAKQSIYRFRGADVTVFEEVRAEFESRSGEQRSNAAGLPRDESSKHETKRSESNRSFDQPSLPFPDPEPGARTPLLITMSDCFRTHSGLVSFFNYLFSSVFVSGNQYRVAYEPMSAARMPLQNSPAVELHIVTRPEGSTERLGAEAMREAEAILIAQRIEEIIGKGEVTVYDQQGSNKRLRGAEYGDLALLFQVSTNFDLYEQALADRRIPYVTIAGRGFYDRQEITDLNNLLAFLVSPSDSLRLAAALRSPMFSLSDETLLRLRLSPRPLWESLCDEGVEVSEDERHGLEFARRVLRRLRSIVGRASPADVISAALAETGYLATLMALRQGERRVANVEKLVEQARALKSITLSELIERIGELKLREAREGEATIEEAGAVRLMTVHKAKGLEFPIVWIADAACGAYRDSSVVMVHPKFGISTDVRGDGIGPVGESSRPASFEMMRLIEEGMDRAEKRRLLYVAATRARDYLILSGGLRGRLRGDHWLGLIAEGLGLADPAESGSTGCVPYPGGVISVAWHDAATVLAQAEAGLGRSDGQCGWDRYENRFKAATEPTPAPASIDWNLSTAETDLLDRFPLIRAIQ